MPKHWTDDDMAFAYEATRPVEEWWTSGTFSNRLTKEQAPTIDTLKAAVRQVRASDSTDCIRPYFAPLPPALFPRIVTDSALPTESPAAQAIDRFCDWLNQPTLAQRFEAFKREMTALLSLYKSLTYVFDLNQDMGPFVEVRHPDLPITAVFVEGSDVEAKLQQWAQPLGWDALTGPRGPAPRLGCLDRATWPSPPEPEVMSPRERMVARIPESPTLLEAFFAGMFRQPRPRARWQRWKAWWSK